MEIVNATGMSVAWTQGLDPDGTERALVVVKGTFDIPRGGGEVQLAPEQLDFVYADTFTGEPGESAVVYESDFAPSKPRCDVLLLGHAHAPAGRALPAVRVGLRVGTLRKHFEVVGPRYWTGGIGGVRPSAPHPFDRLPISYDCAFGGGEVVPSDPSLRNTYAPNPVGVGYFKESGDTEVFGKPVPNTQEPGNPVSSPRGKYRPMSFGPIGRNFPDRRRFAGTYDERWLDETFPFLPADFDARYFQSAPPDQQLERLEDGAPVQLVNLTATPQAPFTLPSDLALPIEFTNVDFERTTVVARADTVIIEPDERRLQLLWRASLPLRRNIQEIAQAVVGRMSQAWYRARDLGKSYYPSLSSLVATRRGKA